MGGNGSGREAGGHLLLGGFVEDVGHPALPAVLPVEVRGHEDPGPALAVVALPPEPSDLPVLVNLVVAKNRELHLLLLMLVLFGGRVVLLLPLLGPAPESEDQVKGGLLLNVVVAEGPAIFELLPREDESLLIRRDPLLVLDLGLHIFDSIARFDLKSDGLSGQGFHEDLHLDLLTWFKRFISPGSNWRMAGLSPITTSKRSLPCSWTSD